MAVWFVLLLLNPAIDWRLGMALEREGRSLKWVL